MIKTNKRSRLLTLWLLVAVLGLAGCFNPLPGQDVPLEIGDRSTLVDPGVSNFIVPTYQPTAQPGVVIENNSAGSTSLRIENGSGTPVAEVYQGGGSAWSGGATVNNWVAIAAPTAQATGIPAAAISNAGVGAILNLSGSALEYQFDGTTLDLQSNNLEADLNTEHLMFPSVITATVQYTPTSGTVATIADGEVWLIHAVYANVSTNFDCTGDDCDVQIGDGGDADGLLDLDDAELQAADTEGTGAAAGWQGFMSTSTRGAYLANGLGFVYAPSGAAETIDYAVGGTDPAAGTLDVYVVYTRIK